MPGFVTIIQQMRLQPLDRRRLRAVFLFLSFIMAERCCREDADVSMYLKKWWTLVIRRETLKIGLPFLSLNAKRWLIP